MNPKKPHQSNTIRVNTLAILLSYGLAKAGYVVPGEVQIAALAVVNYFLRMITKGAVSFSD